VWLKPRLPQELMQSHSNVHFVYFEVNTWEVRLFTQGTNRGNLVVGLLSEEEVRVKPQPQAGS
jgi:hypothetical protein